MIRLTHIAVSQDAPPHGPIRRTMRLLIPRSGLTGDMSAAVQAAITDGKRQLDCLRRPAKRRKQPAAERSYLTPPQLAEEMGVSEDKVLAWIAAGELKAFNAAQSSKSKRPRWRISREEIARFEATRTAATPPPARISRRRKKAKRRWY